MSRRRKGLPSVASLQIEPTDLFILKHSYYTHTRVWMLPPLLVLFVIQVWLVHRVCTADGEERKRGGKKKKTLGCHLNTACCRMCSACQRRCAYLNTSSAYLPLSHRVYLCVGGGEWGGGHASGSVLCTQWCALPPTHLISNSGKFRCCWSECNFFFPPSFPPTHARYLISQGANVGVVNSEGETPLDIAEEEAMEELLQNEINRQGALSS